MGLVLNLSEVIFSAIFQLSVKFEDLYLLSSS